MIRLKVQSKKSVEGLEKVMQGIRLDRCVEARNHKGRCIITDGPILPVRREDLRLFGLHRSDRKYPVYLVTEVDDCPNGTQVLRKIILPWRKVGHIYQPRAKAPKYLLRHLDGQGPKPR